MQTVVNAIASLITKFCQGQELLVLCDLLHTHIILGPMSKKRVLVTDLSLRPEKVSTETTI